ncbi:hypothetical protein SAMN05661096_00304 [Marivirga sericea]|uniref:Tripartite ATP-independent transporter, DctQ component n=1 Tax=Marivirga sericea TaxID=1028 RepID=A0A1X7I6Z4_9BACT|nr:hypothetical protein [Marivirga sericea]SMG10281.1 hypothetical protein SAMN05661096_00304 [Marivirga sericea]
MKLEYVRQSFDVFTTKASDLSRQLCFAGIAIIWIFKVYEGTEFKLPEILYKPLLIFCLALLSDLMQFIYGSVMIGILLRITSAKQAEDDVHYPRVLNFPTWFFFVAKIVLLIIAYIVLINFLMDKNHLFST